MLKSELDGSSANVAYNNTTDLKRWVATECTGTKWILLGRRLNSWWDWLNRIRDFLMFCYF